MVTEAKTTNYWISNSALYIQLNATGEPNRIQASVVSGASILCYMQGIDGLGYDAGHNYQRWTLAAYPSEFPSDEKRYVYAAIPRKRTSGNDIATIVFPSQKIDIYGKAIVLNTDEEGKQEEVVGDQIGSEDYYYIYLQGIISEVYLNNANDRVRKWVQDVDFGSLSTDEALASGGVAQWWKYNSVSDTVTFLKTIFSATFDSLVAKTISVKELFFGKKKITGIASDQSQEDSEEEIVTPKYLKKYGGGKYLSKVNDDTANGLINFAKGLTAGSYKKGVSGGNMDSEGNAETNKLTARGDTQLRGDTFFGTGSDKTNTPHVDGGSGDALLGDMVLKALQSKDFDALLQRGFGFTKGMNGKFTLSVTDLMVWGKAVFNELEIRKLSSVGGNVYLSGASSKIAHVKEEMQDGRLVGWRCYILADDGTTATQNGWKMYDQARCQTFNISAGSYEGVGNRNYWRLVTGVSSTNETITDDEGNDLYNGKKFAWVVLSATDCEDKVTNDVPAVGDVIVLDGHRQFAEDDARAVYNDASRTNIMMLQTTGSEGSVPNIISLHGIVDYKHSASNNKYRNTVFILSPEEVVFLSSRFKWISASGAPITLVNFRGPWKQGETYYYYDQVSHNNAIWTCIVAEGSSTTEEPTDESEVWRKELTGGAPGADGLAYVLQVTSDKGVVLVNGVGSLILTGTLYRNGEDVTSTIAEGNWSWYRVSADTEDDAVWNRLHEGVGNTCRITGEDVSRVAQFGCRTYVQDTSSAKVLTIDSLEQ